MTLRDPGLSAALTILHVDMDAFYASVEQRDRPELCGRPVIVGGLGGRGVVCAASYEARPFGVHSAMPMATARRLCPQAVYVAPRMTHYSQIGRQIREILLSFTPQVEPLSLDEAFLDVQGCAGLHGQQAGDETGPAAQIARQIKARVRYEVGLTASVGVAPNKFLAKLASDHGKPDGLVVVDSESVSEFLASLPVSRIWGVGKKAENRLQALGIHTIGQLAAISEELLADHFGQMGCRIWQLAHGQDERCVVPDREAKSISTETTFPEDIGDRDLLRDWLLDLTDQLAGRLRQAGLQARTVELKIRSSDFRTRHRAGALGEPSNVTSVLWQGAQTIFERSVTPDLLPVRLLGVGASRLTREAARQRNLFDGEATERQQELDRTVDAIRGQFGAAAVRRASSLDRSDKKDA
jgi:DNA polymerase-4